MKEKKCLLSFMYSLTGKSVYFFSKTCKSFIFGNWMKIIIMKRIFSSLLFQSNIFVFANGGKNKNFNIKRET